MEGAALLFARRFLESGASWTAGRRKLVCTDHGAALFLQAFLTMVPLLQAFLRVVGPLLWRQLRRQHWDGCGASCGFGMAVAPAAAMELF